MTEPTAQIRKQRTQTTRYLNIRKSLRIFCANETHFYGKPACIHGSSRRHNRFCDTIPAVNRDEKRTFPRFFNRFSMAIKKFLSLLKRHRANVGKWIMASLKRSRSPHLPRILCRLQGVLHKTDVIRDPYVFILYQLQVYTVQTIIRFSLRRNPNFFENYHEYTRYYSCAFQ